MLRRNGERNSDTIRFFNPSWQWRDLVGPAWTLSFAVVALLDVWGCCMQVPSFSSSPSWLVLLNRHGVDNLTREQSHQQPNPLQKILAVATSHGKEKFRPRESQPPQNQYYSSLEDTMGTCPAILDEDDEMDHATSTLACATSTFLTMVTSTASTVHDWLLLHSTAIGIFFCCLCIIESVRKALEARQLALDMAALDEFERKLARLYSATKRSNVFTSLRHPSMMMRGWGSTTNTNSSHDHHDEYHDEDGSTDVIVTRKFIRVWTPVLSTLFGWAILLPWPALMAAIVLHTSPAAAVGRAQDSATSMGLFEIQGYGHCQIDPSLATRWIARSIVPLLTTVRQFHEELMDLVWKAVVPLHLLLRNPIGFIHRLRLVSRWIRYLRYAGPLLRLLVKLQDQLLVFGKTWRQKSTLEAEKEKRVVRRSMLFEDLRRIESFAKFETALASISSTHLFSLSLNNPPAVIVEVESMDASDGEAGSTSITNHPPEIVRQSWFEQKKRDGQRLLTKLDELKRKVEKSSRIFPSSEIYDRVVDLTQEVTTQVQSAFWNSHLISPLTRFSIAWRLVVTCTLISELLRLYTSWHLYGTFDLRYRPIFQHLLGLCQKRSRPVRNFFKRIFPGIGLNNRRPWFDTICDDSSPSANIVLRWASLCDTAIDVVGFLDIFVWFYTGELTATGIVVPKPFFYRCVLPGTLLQILDHPTVPTAIPNLLVTIFKAATSVGYGRFIRWGWALYPAIELLFMTPVSSYLFKPMNNDEYMSYTGSTLGGIMGQLSSGALMKNHHTPTTTVTPGVGATKEPLASHNTVREQQSYHRLHQLNDNHHQGSMAFENSMSESDGYGLYYY